MQIAWCTKTNEIEHFISEQYNYYLCCFSINKDLIFFCIIATCVLDQPNKHLSPDGSIWKPFECGTPDDCGYNFELVDGVFQITSCKLPASTNGDTTKKAILHPYPCIEEFMEDQKFLMALSIHGPVYVYFQQYSKRFTFSILIYIFIKSFML